MVRFKDKPWKVNPKCLNCGGKGCIEVEIFDSSKLDFTWTQCNNCLRWWERRLDRIIEIGEPILVAQEEREALDKDMIIPSKNEGLSRQHRALVFKSEEALEQYRKDVQSGMYNLNIIRLDNSRPSVDRPLRAEDI